MCLLSSAKNYGKSLINFCFAPVKYQHFLTIVLGYVIRSANGLIGPILGFFRIAPVLLGLVVESAGIKSNRMQL